MGIFDSKESGIAPVSSTDSLIPTSDIVEQTLVSANLLLMVDIESLALGPRPVITQIALLGYDLELDELLDDRFFQHLPIEPQQQILPARKISASTLVWWMSQPDEARESFKLNEGDDFEDLVAAMRGFIAAFNRLTRNGTRDYELCAKSPKFDIVALETLIEELGLDVPWSYKNITDVRQDLRRAGIEEKNVPKPAGFIAHNAHWDARWQIESFLAARRARGQA